MWFPVRLGAKAGVQDCHPHRFRHTFAVNVSRRRRRNGGNAFELQMALGHTTLQMVQTYLALAQMIWTRRTGRRRRWRIGDYRKTAEKWHDTAAPVINAS